MTWNMDAADWNVARDLGRKAADDAAAAVDRTVALVDGSMQSFAITLYAAAALVGKAGGTFAGANGCTVGEAVEATIDVLREFTSCIKETK